MKAHQIFRFLFGFSGRMARRPFWITYVAEQIVVIALAIILINVIEHDVRPSYWDEKLSWLSIVGSILLMIILLAAIVSILALISRRLHDTGRSFGGYIGLCFLNAVCSMIPVLGTIISLGLSVWVIVMLCQSSDNGDNEYGPAPLQSAKEETQREVCEQSSQEEHECTHLNGILLEPCEEDDQLLFEEAEADWTV